MTQRTDREDKQGQVVEGFFNSSVVKNALIPVAVLAAGAWINSTLSSALQPIREDMARTSVTVSRLAEDVRTLRDGMERDRADIVALRVQVAAYSKMAPPTR